MGDFQIKKQPKKYDAVIVGSGAGGGMAAYVLAHAGLKSASLKQDLYTIRKKTSHSLKIRGIHHDVGLVPKRGHLETLMQAMVGGNLKVSLTRMLMVHSGIGGDQGCLVGVPTIGEEFRCVSVPKTLKEKVSTDLVMTGQLAMKI
jgi:hypothetical protein